MATSDKEISPDVFQKETPFQIEFDLDKMTVQDMNDLAAAERSLDLVRATAIIARVATKCSLGDPHDPKTYLRQPLRMYWRISNAFGEAMRAEVEAEKKS